MEPLSRLLGSAARLKLMRLFLFNDDAAFTVTEAAFRTKNTKDVTRKEIALLVSIGVLRKRTGRDGGFVANKRFEHYEPLKVFIRDTTDLGDAGILEILRKAGALRLVTLSGIFTGASESKVDILVVGDKLDERKLGSCVRTLEAELGREMRYACFSVEEFKYRRGVYDRLLRDVFDYPNRMILDRIGIVKNT